MTTDERSIQQFIEDEMVKMTVERWHDNPNADDDKWANDARHWRCTLRRGAKRMTLYFSQGSAHTEQPSTADVLDCLASDAAGYENSGGSGMVGEGDFEAWAEEYGYDADSRKAERTFKAVERQTKALYRLLGHEAYDALLWHTTRQ